MPQLMDGLVAPLTGEIVDTYSANEVNYGAEQLGCKD